ncbi:DNA mismatch repair protein MutL [compost metagenome]
MDLDTKELFLETLDEINTVARTAKQEIEEKFIATVACKAAVKANMLLDSKEVESLIDDLLQLPNPFTCPHGRPTAIKMSKYDIEKKFARR